MILASLVLAIAGFSPKATGSVGSCPNVNTRDILKEMKDMDGEFNGLFLNEDKLNDYIDSIALLDIEAKRFVENYADPVLLKSLKEIWPETDYPEYYYGSIVLSYSLYYFYNGETNWYKDISALYDIVGVYRDVIRRNLTPEGFKLFEKKASKQGYGLLIFDYYWLYDSALVVKKFFIK